MSSLDALIILLVVLGGFGLFLGGPRVGAIIGGLVSIIGLILRLTGRL